MAVDDPVPVDSQRNDSRYLRSRDRLIQVGIDLSGVSNLGGREGRQRSERQSRPENRASTDRMWSVEQSRSPLFV
jgi:hypothetical protein